MNKMEPLLSTDLSTRIDGQTGKKKRKEEEIYPSSYSDSFEAPYERKIIFIPNLFRYGDCNRRIESFLSSSRYESMNK